MGLQMPPVFSSTCVPEWTHRVAGLRAGTVDFIRVLRTDARWGHRAYSIEMGVVVRGEFVQTFQSSFRHRAVQQIFQLLLPDGGKCVRAVSACFVRQGE